MAMMTIEAVRCGDCATQMTKITGLFADRRLPLTVDEVEARELAGAKCIMCGGQVLLELAPA